MYKIKTSPLPYRIIFLLLFINSSKAYVNFYAIFNTGCMAELNEATISAQKSHQPSCEKIPNFYLVNPQPIILQIYSSDLSLVVLSFPSLLPYNYV